MTHDVRLFKVWRACFPHHNSIVSTLARHKLPATAKIQKLQFFEDKTRQAQAAVSEETANIQPPSDDEQPEPTLVYIPRSSPTTIEVSVTVVTNKGNKRKSQVSEGEGDEVPTTTATLKAVKGENKIPKFKKIKISLN